MIVVEGYMDAIALANAGIDEAVAPLGTALTEDQLRLLWRAGGEPVVCLDGDSAGTRAAATAAERADNARSHCLPQTKWITNGNDKIANPKSVRVA